MIDCENLQRKGAIIALCLKEQGDAYKLGAILAPIFYLDWNNFEHRPARLRFGLIGTPHTGKTSFLKGVRTPLTNQFNFENQIAKNSSGKPIQQFTLHATEMGHLRFIDMGFGKNSIHILRSYRFELINAFGHPGTDFIEHADRDFFPTEFDGAINLQWFLDEDGNRYRAARLFLSEALLKRQNVQDALKKACELFPPEPEPAAPSQELIALFS